MFLAATLVSGTVWVHWPVLSARALSFDDDQYLLENRLVQTPSWQSVQHFFGDVLTPSIVTGYYQPLAMTSLMLDVAVGGGPENLRPFHRTSLIIHVLNALLVAGLLYQLFGNAWTATAVGLLFGIHPLTVEPVAWIAERKTLLAMFFCLLALIAYIRYTKSKRWKTCYCLCLVAYVLALLSKPSSTPLPLVMMLLDLWPLRRFGLRIAREKLPLIAVGFISASITILSQRQSVEMADPAGGSVLGKTLVVCHNLVFYLFKTAWPAQVSGYYPYPEPLSIADPMVLLGVVGTGAMMCAVLVSLRWTRAILIGWLVFVVLLSPTLGMITFTHAIAADRHAYLPLLGVLIILVWLLGAVWATAAGSRLRAVRIITSLLLVGALALEARATRQHLRCWEDTETLYRHMAGLAPDAPAVQLNLAIALEEAGKVKEAIALYRRTLEMRPVLVEANVSLARALARQEGLADEVIALYTGALQLRPDYAEAHNNLGYFLLTQGRTADALSHCRRAVELKPDYADAHTNMGLALAALGQFEAAVREHRRALAIDPGHLKAHNNLAVALAQSGRTTQAIEHFQRVLQLDPQNAEARNNLALALMDTGQNPAAESLLRAAVGLKPDYADARVNLAVALTVQNRLQEAVEQYREALRINPADGDVHRRLGDLFQRLGQEQTARAAYLEALRWDPQNQSARDSLSALAASRSASRPSGR